MKGNGKMAIDPVGKNLARFEALQELSEAIYSLCNTRRLDSSDTLRLLLGLSITVARRAGLNLEVYKQEVDEIWAAAGGGIKA